MGNEEFRLNWIKNVLASIPSGESILDAGAGELRWKSDCSHLKYVSQDFCEYKGGNSGGLQFDTWDTSGIDIVSDITDIPVEDETFDNILCSEVFEHIVNAENAVTEFSRILKTGGKLILTAPFCSLTHMAPYHYVSGFNVYWYKEVLDRHGFDVVEITANGNYFSYICQEIGRLPSVLEKYGKDDNLRKINKFSQKIYNELSKYIDEDNQSSELLCFGYNVIAIKRP